MSAHCVWEIKVIDFSDKGCLLKRLLRHKCQLKGLKLLRQLFSQLLILNQKYCMLQNWTVLRDLDHNVSILCVVIYVIEMIQTFNWPDVVYIHSKAMTRDFIVQKHHKISQNSITWMLYSKSSEVFFLLCRKILRHPCKFMLICIQKSRTGRVIYWACWSREENMTWARTKGPLWTGQEDSATDTRWGRFRKYIRIFTTKTIFIRCILGCFSNSIENVHI